MIHDYWMHRKDEEFVKSFLPGIREVLAWHQKNLQQNKLLGKLRYWSFVDWPDEWPWKGSDELSGVPAGALEGNSSILSMQYAYTLAKAAEIFKALGRPAEGEKYAETAKEISSAVYKLCRDKEKGLISDTPDKKEFSQHANVMAVLANVIPKAEEAPVLKRILNDKSLIQCTIYYRFYMNQAFKKAGLGDMYTEMLNPWQNMLSMGLTTFAERPEPTRSDCHAWSASPNYDFLATVCGIEPSIAGFKRVKIEPRLGNLDWVEGKVPHPYGAIEVKFKRKGAGVLAEITLPRDLPGDFVWNGKKVPLHVGYQKIEL
jgi:hypothetical protein